MPKFNVRRAVATAGLAGALALSGSAVAALADNADTDLNTGEVNAVAQETSIIYVANGGAFADGSVMQQGVTDADGYARQPLAPTQEGYEFTGWYYDSSCTTPVDFSAPIVAGSGHATLFAGWAEVQAPAQETEILYVANGGVFADGNGTMQGVTDANG